LASRWRVEVRRAGEDRRGDGRLFSRSRGRARETGDVWRVGEGDELREGVSRPEPRERQVSGTGGDSRGCGGDLPCEAPAVAPRSWVGIVVTSDEPGGLAVPMTRSGLGDCTGAVP